MTVQPAEPATAVVAAAADGGPVATGGYEDVQSRIRDVDGVNGRFYIASGHVEPLLFWFLVISRVGEQSGAAVAAEYVGWLFDRVAARRDEWRDDPRKAIDMLVDHVWCTATPVNAEDHACSERIGPTVEGWYVGEPITDATSGVFPVTVMGVDGRSQLLSATLDDHGLAFVGEDELMVAVA